jgi:hypothetical protein
MAPAVVGVGVDAVAGGELGAGEEFAVRAAICASSACTSTRRDWMRAAVGLAVAVVVAAGCGMREFIGTRFAPSWMLVERDTPIGTVGVSA